MREAFSPTGEIASLDLIPALLRLSRESGSADLTFRRAGEEIEFLLREGELAGLSVPETHSPAQILIRSGKIQADTYRRLAVPEGEDHFSVAVSSGVITRREALWAQKIAAIEALADLLSWTEGSYELAGASGKASEEFRLPVERWILEFFLRSRDRPFVVEKLGPLDTVLARTERFGDLFPSLGLTADADAVVGLVDGRSTIQEIARKSPSEEFSVLKLLAALLSLGLVRPEWGEPPAEAAPELPPEIPPAPPPPPEPEIAPVPEINLFAVTTPVESPVEAAEREAMNAAELTPLEPAGEPPAEDAGRSRLPRLVITGAILAAGAGAAIYWLSRSAAPAPRPPERTPPSHRAVEPARPPVEPAPRTGAAAAAPASPGQTGPMRPAPARPAAKLPAVPKEEPSAGGRNWGTMAERGLREFRRPGRYRYAIQLEIACETETLRRAYAHAGDGREIWIIPYAFHGRACYRVLWGRFKTLEAARKAKSGVPAIFLSGSSRPAVVPLGGP